MTKLPQKIFALLRPKPNAGAMPRLPVMSGREVVRAFEKFGWQVARPGNHIILVKEGARATLSVPDHKEVARGTLRSLIRAAGLTVEESLKTNESPAVRFDLKSGNLDEQFHPLFLEAALIATA